MMVYAFGINLDASVLEDVQKAKVYLDKTHSGWPQLQAFARDVMKGTSLGRQLNFDEMVQVAEKIGEGYVKWQGQDCLRVKQELSAKPSHHDGYVKLSDVKLSESSGRRTLFTESAKDLEKLGVLRDTNYVVKPAETETELIIPNYVNSQSMCLSTASFYTACCVNECEGLLSKLERDVAAPTADHTQLTRVMAALPGKSIPEPLLKELPSLADKNTGLVSLHGRELAGWMHRAFPLECPAPDKVHDQKVTNPKTPDEWMGESDLKVSELEEMMEEIAQVLARYTTMGNKSGVEAPQAEDDVSDPDVDVVRVRSQTMATMAQGDQPQRSLLATAFQLAAMFSMIGLVVVAAKSALSATSSRKDKVDKVTKDFV
jgi:hypothetical protein